ncbi:MAG: hypothetical protein AAFV77_08320, partial [Planctomycetota bacterium]
MTAIAHEPLLADSNVQRQIERERDALEDGIGRDRRITNEMIRSGRGSELAAAAPLLRHWHEPMMLKIQDDCKEFKKTGFCRDATVEAMALLSDLEPQRAAFLTTKSAVSFLMAHPEGESVTRVAYACARMCIADYNVRKFKKAHGAQLWREIYGRVRRVAPIPVQSKLRKHFDDGVYQIAMLHGLGGKLLALLTQVASAKDYEDEFQPAFRISHRARNKRVVAWIELTDDAQRILWEGQKIREVLRPLHQPMVCTPWPWLNGGDRPGGYLVNRTPLIAKFKAAQRERIKDCNLDRVKAAVDAQGRVAKRVNRRVFETAMALWDRGGEFAGQPRAQDIPLPVLPAGYNGDGARGTKWSHVPPEAREAWNQERIEVRRKNAFNRGKRAAYWAA